MRYVLRELYILTLHVSEHVYKDKCHLQSYGDVSYNDHILAYMHACRYCVRTYMYTYVHAYLHIYIRTYIHMYTYVHACMHIHKHTWRTYTHTHTYAYIYTYIHTYIHTYILQEEVIDAMSGYSLDIVGGQHLCIIHHAHTCCAAWCVSMLWPLCLLVCMHTCHLLAGL